jgi:hypothetical protein
MRARLRNRRSRDLTHRKDVTIAVWIMISALLVLAVAAYLNYPNWTQ